MSLTKVTNSMIVGAAINVLDQGATTAAIDNTSAFNSAVTLANASTKCVVIPGGTYNLASTWTIPTAQSKGLRIVSDGKVILNFTGIGVAVALGDSAVNDLYDLVFGGDQSIEIVGSATCTDTLNCLGLINSSVNVRLRNCTGVAARIKSCVYSNFEIVATINEGTWTTIPQYGIYLENGGNAKQTSNCIFTNATIAGMTSGVGAGIVCAVSFYNTFIGGSSVANKYGVVTAPFFNGVGSEGDMFYGLFTELNSVTAYSIQGFYTSVTNPKISTGGAPPSDAWFHLEAASRHCSIFGGYVFGLTVDTSAPPFNGAATYFVNDTVISGGLYYTSRTNHTSATLPASDTTNWVLDPPAHSITGSYLFPSNPITGTGAAMLLVSQCNVDWKPSFLANNTVTDTAVTGDGTLYTVVCNAEAYDITSSYDLSTGIFTAPIAGKYLLSFTVGLASMGAAHTDQVIQIVTTARTYQTNDIFTSNPFTRKYPTMTVVADMAMGDTAAFKIQISGSTKTVDVIGGTSPFSTFVSGRLL